MVAYVWELSNLNSASGHPCKDSEISCTPSKVLEVVQASLPRAIYSGLFLKIPQGSTIVHSFCTSGKRFYVAARGLLPQSGFTENVGTLNTCQTIDCGDAGGSWRFSRVNCQGKNRKCARVRAGCPGIAASSTSCSMSGMGRWPTA